MTFRPLRPFRSAANGHPIATWMAGLAGVGVVFVLLVPSANTAAPKVLSTLTGSDRVTTVAEVGVRTDPAIVLRADASGSTASAQLQPAADPQPALVVVPIAAAARPGGVAGPVDEASASASLPWVMLTAGLILFGGYSQVRRRPQRN